MSPSRLFPIALRHCRERAGLIQDEPGFRMNSAGLPIWTKPISANSSADSRARRSTRSRSCRFASKFGRKICLVRRPNAAVPDLPPPTSFARRATLFAEPGRQAGSPRPDRPKARSAAGPGRMLAPGPSPACATAGPHPAPGATQTGANRSAGRSGDEPRARDK